MALTKIEVTGHIDKNHHLIVDQEVPFGPGEVKVIVFPDKQMVKEDIPATDLLESAMKGNAFNFLDDPEEDIYSTEDGVPF